ncbi:repeat protein [Cotonvirus japonicus]|uniref:Repeat protein n=1 Tax=Cotonvirus japonicus TaxID=2811091 RepID=A0ABM7NUK7_9VIRU|nr:repeat protein [Cotonvirus japonicus]BCS83757.1 repeat protein [Cotonvirus japonicus]
MSTKLYFKITNESECHNGFKYVNGLNILREEFNNDPKASCVGGRLYFTKPKHICKYLDYGVYLREIYLPTDNPDFKIVKDPSGDKYGANMIILGERRDLKDIKTWKHMISIGIDIHADDDYALIKVSEYGYLEVVKYLVEHGANIHAKDDGALRKASSNGHLEVVKYLVKNGADIHADDNDALGWASQNGHIQVVKYLIESGADIHADDDLALREASENGHLEVVKYLVKNGANIHAYNDYALIWSSENEHLEVVKYLVEQAKKSAEYY